MVLSVILFISFAYSIFWGLLIGLGGISFESNNSLPGLITFIFDISSILYVVITIMNIIGLILCLVHYKKEKSVIKNSKTRLILAIVLNAIPLSIIAGAYINQLFQAFIGS